MKSAVRRVFSRLGLDIHRTNGIGIRPLATHAPWRVDKAFQLIHAQVRDNTMVDVYRLYELWVLVDQIAHLEGDIVEVGVWRGGSGVLMAHRAKELGMRSTVYLCDTFRGMVKTSDKDPLYRGGELSDTSSSIVHDLAGRMRLKNVRICEGIFPEESEHLVVSTDVSLCHIDVDVYESARDVLAWVWPRMRIGALIVYDDYGFPTCAGITRHVDEQRSLSDRVVIHNLNGHAIVVKTAST